MVCGYDLFECAGLNLELGRCITHVRVVAVEQRIAFKREASAL
jgi:hypothetical protein